MTPLLCVCVCLSCPVKCGLDGHTVYIWRHAASSEFGGVCDWLPATRSLSCSHRDAVPDNTLSICFTTHKYSHTQSSVGAAQVWQAATCTGPLLHEHTQSTAHQALSVCMASVTWLNCGSPSLVLFTTSFAPRCLLASGPNCGVMTLLRGEEEEDKQNWRVKIFQGQWLRRQHRGREDRTRRNQI